MCREPFSRVVFREFIPPFRDCFHRAFDVRVVLRFMVAQNYLIVIFNIGRSLLTKLELFRTLCVPFRGTSRELRGEKDCGTERCRKGKCGAMHGSFQYILFSLKKMRFFRVFKSHFTYFQFRWILLNCLFLMIFTCISARMPL